MSQTPVEQILRQDRWLMIFGLAIICLLAWWYILDGAGTGMDILAMSTRQFPPPIHAQRVTIDWDYQYWIIMTLMWWVMMVAMMLPSAAPMILLYAKVYRQAQRNQQVNAPLIPTTAFAGGYLLVWFGFSLLATLLQWSLEQVGLIHAMVMWSSSYFLSGIFLVIAGLYQFSSLKNACLQQCRSPVQFVAKNWRAGRYGAGRMGVMHGAYCLGCCWSLMLLLFVGGIMNLVWIAGLSVFVLIEKLLPLSKAFNVASGLLVIIAGLWVLAR